MELWDRLTASSEPCAREQVLARAELVPRVPGVYGWRFRSIPGDVDPSGCQSRDGLTLLYVGISPKRPPTNGRPPSGQDLRSRIRTHYAGNAEGSTLRAHALLPVGGGARDRASVRGLRDRETTATPSTRRSPRCVPMPSPDRAHFPWFPTLGLADDDDPLGEVAEVCEDAAKVTTLRVARHLSGGLRPEQEVPGRSWMPEPDDQDVTPPHESNVTRTELESVCQSRRCAADHQLESLPVNEEREASRIGICGEHGGPCPRQGRERLEVTPVR